MPTPNLQGILVRVPKDVHKKLKERARKENRTLNNLIVTLILNAVKKS